jgi:hypothetical protein
MLLPRLIKIISVVIVLLGIVHISFAFPIYLNTDTLWFVGAGFAIIFSGLINLIAIENGGTKFSLWIAFLCNAFNCALFCIALTILNEPQVYFGIIIFLLAAISFLVEVLRLYKKR